MERKELFREQKTRQPFPIMIDGARAGLQVKRMLDSLEKYDDYSISTE